MNDKDESLNIGIGDTVKKISGKPFKSGAITAKISRFKMVDAPTAPKNGIRSTVTRLAYEFFTEEVGYHVTAGQCQKVS